MAGKYLGKGTTKVGEIERSIVDGKWKSWAFGIDIHKYFAQVAVIIPDYDKGSYTKYQRKFDTDISSLRGLRLWLDEFKADHGKTSFAIESTSTYHRPVVCALFGHYDLILVNPLHAGEQKKKDDKFDAGKLAYHALTGIWPISYIYTDTQHQAKVISRRLQKTVNAKTAASNAIGSTLLDFNIPLSREIKMLSASGIAILESITGGEKDPEKAASAARYYFNSSSPAVIEKFGKIVDSLTDLPKLPQTIIDTVENLYEIAKFNSELSIQYSDMLDQLLMGETIEYEDGRVLNGLQLQELLLTMKSVGKRYTQVFLAEFGLNIVERFGSAAAACAFAGLDPSKYVSADKVVSTKSRKGNVFLHAQAVQCAQSLLQKGKRSNPLAIWGRSLKARNGGDGKAHNNAVAAVAKRIIIASFHVVRLGKEYDDSGYDYTVHKVKSVQKIRRMNKSIEEIEHGMKGEELDDMIKTAATETIAKMSSLIGIKGGLILNPDVPDMDVVKLGLSTRTVNLLRKNSLDKVSNVWFSILNGSILEIEKFGEKSYEEVVGRLRANGYLLEAS